MNSLFADPFQQMLQMGSNGFGFGGFPQHAPLTFPNMHVRNIHPQIQQSRSQMMNYGGENAVSYSSSSVYSMNGGQVYQSTHSSTKCLASGVKETKQTVQDSRSGTKKMTVGRFLGDRYTFNNNICVFTVM